MEVDREELIKDIVFKTKNMSIEQDKEMSARSTVLENLYGGYFGSQENCAYFSEHIPEDFFLRKNPTILDAGSSMGTVGKYVQRELLNKGVTSRLVLVDTNEEALKKSTSTAEKIVANLKGIPLPDSSVDMILLRSVLHYEPTLEAQQSIIKELHRVLIPGGILISQFGSFKDDKEAESFNQMFKFLKRDVGFVSSSTGVRLHEEVFGKAYKITNGPPLEESVTEFVERNGEDVSAGLIDYVKEHRAELHNVLVNDNPLTWRVGFTIASFIKE